MAALLVLFYFVVAVMLPSARAADTCNATAIRLPITNVTLSSEKIRRGVQIKIGEPPQALAFQPKWGNNNTYIWGPDCFQEDFVKTVESCRTFRGGLFEPAKSSSFAEANDSYVPAVDPFPPNSYTIASDTATLTDDVSVEGFPFGQGSNITEWGLQAYDPLNIIGMSTGSVLLERLYQSRKIASRSWGYFWGLDGTSSKYQMDGSFVLGGYDKAKTIGNGYTGTISDNRDNCPSGILVTIRDILLNYQNGTDASIFGSSNGGDALVACVTPDLPVMMEMPRDPQFNNLLTQIENDEGGRSTGIDWWNIRLSYPNSFGGDITVKFQGGAEFTVPNNQLFAPMNYIDKEGSIKSNSSQTIIRINGLQSTTAQAIPKLGRYFFTSAYLHSNEDAGKFTIWKANPTSDEDIVAVDEKNAIVTTIPCQPTAIPSATTPPAAPTDTKSGISTGAIAGIAVGAVAAVAAVAVISWLLWRKKKKAAAAKEVPPDYYQRPMSPAKPENYYPSQGIPHYIPQELPGQRREPQVVEMAG